MLYHASPIGGLIVLTPHISNHSRPLVYFSKKRENVLVYLSNAVEKYCRDTGFVHTGRWEKWGPYGFDLDGVQRLEEYYPNALVETYAGVSGYIYGAEPTKAAPFPTCRLRSRPKRRQRLSHASSSPTPMRPFSAQSGRGCCTFCAMRRPASRSAHGYGRLC